MGKNFFESVKVIDDHSKVAFRGKGVQEKLLIFGGTAACFFKLAVEAGKLTGAEGQDHIRHTGGDSHGLQLEGFPLVAGTAVGRVVEHLRQTPEVELLAQPPGALPLQGVLGPLPGFLCGEAEVVVENEKISNNFPQVPPFPLACGRVL